MRLFPWGCLQLFLSLDHVLIRFVSWSIGSFDHLLIRIVLLIHWLELRFDQGCLYWLEMETWNFIWSLHGYNVLSLLLLVTKTPSPPQSTKNHMTYKWEIRRSLRIQISFIRHVMDGIVYKSLIRSNIWTGWNVRSNFCAIALWSRLSSSWRHGRSRGVFVFIDEDVLKFISFYLKFTWL